MFNKQRLTQAAFTITLALAIVSAAVGKELPTSTPEKVGLSSERLARMDRVIHGWVDAGRTPGAIVIVARHGKIVHTDVYGSADLASGRKTRADGLFRMYSMTKPMTSVALLMLFEEGEFQLNDPLAKYLPVFADVKVYAGAAPGGGMLLDSPKRPISVLDVFRHTAGFSYGFGNSPVDQAYQQANVFAKDLNDLVAKVAKLPLLYQPGERWEYSVAHDIQAALVEKLSGMSFDEFVRQRILVPLGMKNTYFKIPDGLRGRVPTLYAPPPGGQGGKLVPDASPLGAGYGDLVFGGFSISSTASDYLIFAQMLLNKGQLDGVRLLGPKTVELMTTNHLGESALNGSSGIVSLGAGRGYGLGVSVLMDPARFGNLGSVGEFGWSGAASTHFIVDPKEDLIAIYATQLMGGDYGIRSGWLTLLYQSIVGP
jgi:CubicO group peptidase (beta-lactamase class C family)